jgi:hypothetical protein
MDEVGRGLVGPVVGLGRRKDKHSYPGPQAEVEDNVDHEAHQKGARHEETIGRTHNCAEIEKGVLGSNGTTLGACNKGHCTRKGSQNIYGTHPGRM